MEVANASLLDEPTAAAEAMLMLFHARSRAQMKEGVSTFLIDENVFPQTLAVLQTRAEAVDIDLQVVPFQEMEIDSKVFGAMVQYPSGDGAINDYSSLAATCNESGVGLVVAADLLSLTLLTPPGEWGADVVIGNTQRFGVPMGYGGPHAAFFATREKYKRQIPGRIIGVSKDSSGKNALRMALQTREQHIRRDKATSNICTAQALLAVMASMYAVYHGPDGLKRIAESVHASAKVLAGGLESIGFKTRHSVFFDTLRLDSQDKQAQIRESAEQHGMNFRYFENGDIGISLDETISHSDMEAIIEVFQGVSGSNASGEAVSVALPLRTSTYMEHEVFHRYRTETELMRYMKRLENKDISLVHSMIALGSCTMKLNPAVTLEPITWAEFANVHPFAPTSQNQGYQTMLNALERYLSEITGFHAVSLQPNSGAQGEYAGLMTIKSYHEDHGDHQRKVVLIPSSAHGTNPASAVMAGYQVKVVKCDELGNIDVEDLRQKAEGCSAELAGLMITYPSTHGVFEARVKDVTDIIHQHGGLVYMDGANMNAQVGLTSPGAIGADVCHLNLHKTFAIPHGGGGPGMGPIGVVERLAPYLPTNPVIPTGGDKPIHAISGAPWGSALILLISYGFIRLLGPQGLRKSTEAAILNANYIRARLEKDFDILYTGESGTVAHEMIIDCRPFKNETGVSVEDIAKRLMDYGYHAPTVSFPVAGTMMIEPTESESKEELDRFVEVMRAIREEIRQIESGMMSKEDNPLVHAPHTLESIMGDWPHNYMKEQAIFPLAFIREQKYWPPVSRIDSAYGDRHLICTCPPMEHYDSDFAEPLVMS